MKIPPQLTIAVLTLSVSLTYAQETPEMPPQESTEAAPQAAKAPSAPNSAMAPTESLRLAGFPMSVLQFEPAISAAFLLTPQQAQELQKALDETVGSAKKDQATNTDKKQVQQFTKQAQKDFESRRGTILSDEQIFLIKTLQSTFKASQVEVKESKPAERQEMLQIKDVFLRNLKTALNADQLTRIEVAGGKLP